MATAKKKGMSREEAIELYKDLRTNLSKVQKSKVTTSSSKVPPGLAKEIAKSISASMARDPVPVAEEISMPRESDSFGPRKKDRGILAALCLVGLVVVIKTSIAILEGTGVVSVQQAQASLVTNRAAASSLPYGKEEIKILTSLDSRRAEIEERVRKIEERELEVGRRDKEFVSKLMQLKDLTEQLRVERDKDDKKRSTQLDQLANVYGSMAPQEAATLMEQLDITIALSLLERMPEKRIGQILALMTPERALAITKLLSERNL